MATLALAGCALYLALAFGLRTLLQVRVVEEPYLLRAQGRRYAEYAASAGRFVPGIGLPADGGTWRAESR